MRNGLYCLTVLSLAALSLVDCGDVDATKANDLSALAVPASGPFVYILSS